MINYKSLFYLAMVIAFISCLCVACGTPQPSIPTATPAPLLGEIKGKLVSSSGSAGIPLGLWGTTCEGSGGFQKMDETGYEAETDEAGAFLFESVQPGCYTMFAYVSSQQVPLKVEGGGLVLIEVVAGQTKDLGSIPFSK